MAVFVPGALPGELVRARITKTAPRYALAELVAVERSAPERTAPPCPHYAACGGCAVQHMSYKGQLAFKQRKVAEALARIGGAAEGTYELRPILAMDDPFRYRNKAEFAVSGTAIGLRPQKSHAVAEVSGCLLLQQAAEDALAAVRGFLRAAKGDAGLSQVTVRVSGGGAVMVVLDGPGPLREAAALTLALRAALPGLTSVVSRAGGRRAVLLGAEALEERIGTLRFRLSPEAFFQVNARQTEALYGIVADLCAPEGHERVLDAYCGTGTMALLLARRAAHVLGVDQEAAAIADARASARLNGVGNAQFVCAPAQEVLPRRAAQGERFEAAVLDPPRAGCDEAALRALAACDPGRIVYVSCDPATLARDIARLRPLGYALRAAAPVDMFPHTKHVETVVSLQRRDP